MKVLSIVLLTIMLCSNSVMAKNADKLPVYATRVVLGDVSFTLPYIQSSTILGGTGKYFGARNLAEILSYYTYYENNKLKFESCTSDINPIIIEFDLKNNVGYTYDKNELIEGENLRDLPSYKVLNNMPIKVDGKYFIHMEEFCQALGLQTQFSIDLLGGGSSYQIINNNLVIITPSEYQAIKEQAVKLMNNDLLDCRCTQAGLTTHITDTKYLETGEGMNSITCYLISEKYGLNMQLPKVKNTTGTYKGNPHSERALLNIVENKSVEGNPMILDDNGKKRPFLNKFAKEFDWKIDRAARFSSDHQMGILKEGFSIDTIIEDYNVFVDLYNQVYGSNGSNAIKLSKIK